MKNTRAKNCDTHWMGGPDFTIEIVSPKDRSRQKLDFYASLGVRELLIIDRYPWSIELYRLEGGKLTDSVKSTMTGSEVLVSQVVPLSFRLVAGGVRPNIEVTHRDGVQKWLV
jgi:Uma2 family endonuclease